MSTAGPWERYGRGLRYVYLARADGTYVAGTLARRLGPGGVLLYGFNLVTGRTRGGGMGLEVHESALLAMRACDEAVALAVLRGELSLEETP